MRLHLHGRCASIVSRYLADAGGCVFVRTLVHRKLPLLVCDEQLRVAVAVEINQPDTSSMGFESGHRIVPGVQPHRLLLRGLRRRGIHGPIASHRRGLPEQYDGARESQTGRHGKSTLCAADCRGSLYRAHSGRAEQRTAEQRRAAQRSEGSSSTTLQAWQQ